MKQYSWHPKYMAIMLVILLAGFIGLGNLHAAGSSVAQSVDVNYQSGAVSIKTVTFTWVADDTDGSVPSTAMTAATLAEIDGWFLYFIETNPDDSTAPTNLYDIVLNDADGLDVVGSALVDRSSSNTERVRPLTESGGSEISIPVDGTLTFVLTNNSVNDAEGTCKLYFTREP